MNLYKKIRLGLAAKLAVCVIVSTAAFFTLFGFLNLRVERAQSQEFVLQSADRITDVILRSTRYEMLHNDRDALYNVVREHARAATPEAAVKVRDRKAARHLAIARES